MKAKELWIQPDRLISPEEFEGICEYLKELTGNSLSPDKKSLVDSRLRKRLGDLGVPAGEYLRLVKGNAEERQLFISVLTTHKTDWFREPVHFEFLKRAVEMAEARKAGEPWMIWSAACSSGEEVYSLAITLRECGIEAFRVLGTDLSLPHLCLARAGAYGARQVESQVPAALRSRYFLRGLFEGRPAYRVHPSIGRHLKWRQFNLIGSTLPAPVQFDFLFLRNILIYFDQPTALHVLRRMISYLKPGGFLVVGLSESLVGSLPGELGLERMENSVYRKC